MSELELVKVEKPVKPKGFRKMSIVFGNGRNTNSRNSRDIHKYMGVKTRYSMWIKRRIESLGAEENVDYIVPKNGNGKKGDFEEIDYIVTDDFAKHLGMVEKNEKGKEVRDYFIYMEKLAKYLILKKVEECDIKTQKALKKKDKVIESKEKVITELKVKQMKTYKDGFVSLTKYLKDRNIKLSKELAWEMLEDCDEPEKVKIERDVHFLRDETFGRQNGTAVIEFNSRALDTVFSEYIVSEKSLFDMGGE